MAVGVRVRVDGDERFQRLLERLPPSARNRWISQALTQGGLWLQRTAATKFIEPGGDHPPLLDRLTSRTGELRRSIEADHAGLPRSIAVGSALKYARVHELGIRPFPKRPYLKPAADLGVSSGKFADIFLRSWSRVAESV